MNKITKSFLMLLLLGAGAVSAQAQEKPDAWFNANHFRAKDYVDHVSPTEEEKDNWADICQNWEKTVPRWVTEEDGNGCIAITTNNWGGQNHHSQFWIKAAPLGLKEGATFHLHFRVKADKAQQIDGQAHYFFDYLTWNNPVGNIDVTNEWQEVDKDVTVAANQAGMTDVCFNLTREAIGSNTIYFDDIEVTNLDNKGEWAEKAPGWAGKLGYAHMQTTWKEGETPSDANKSCASTPAKLVYSEENEDAYLEVVADPKTVNVWDNQFFIQIADANEKNKGKLNQNDKVKLTFWAMAVLDKESTSTATEFDCGGGVHKSNDGKGYLDGFSGVKIKVGEWTKLTLDFNIKNSQITNYAFNLSNDSKPITYRFKDFVAEFTQGNEDWYLNNVIVAKDPAKDYEDGKAYEFPAAPYKVGKGEEGGYIEVKSKAEPATPWASQIFFQVPENLVGKPVEISMMVKASEAIDIDAQRHADNSGAKYGDNYPAGNISFTTEWTPVKIQFDPVKGEGEGATTMTNYVLNIGKKGDVTYYFDDVAFAEHFDWGELVPAEVEGKLVEKNGVKDWTIETSYPYYKMGMPEGTKFDFDADQKALAIENTKEQEQVYSLQPFIMDWTEVEQGIDYKVRLTMKATADGTATLNMGTWTNGAYGVDFEFKKGYTQVVVDFPEYTGTSSSGDVHILFQCGKYIGKVFLEKVELFNCTPDYAAMDWADDNLVVNGDLESDKMEAFVAKVATEDDDDPQILPVEAADLGKYAASQASVWPEGTETIPDGPKGIAINALKQSENGSADETQLWVRLSKVLPAGTVYKVEFDVMSTNITEIPTQIDMNPGTNVSKDGIAKGAAGSTPIKVPEAGKYVHYVNYCKAPEGGVGSIAFNLAGDKAYKYWFDNFSVKVLDDEEVAQAIEDANKDVDEALWDATLDLNVAVNAAKVVDTDGYSEESVKALEEAAKAGRELLDKADATKDALAAAAEDIEDAIAGLEYPYVEMPELDDDFVEIPLSQEAYGDFTKAAVSAGEYEGTAYTVYTASGQIQGGFKMTDIDVTGCDKIYVYFAQPVKKGWSKAFWGKQDDVKDVEEGAAVIEFDLSEKFGSDEATYEQDGKTFLKEATLIALWGTKDFPLTAKVYGVYKHVVGEADAINEVAEDAVLKDGKYFIDGQIVIVKNGVKYNAAGVAIQ